MTQSLKPVDAGTAARLMQDGALMVDVREAGEFAMARIPGSENVALSSLDAVELRVVPGQAVVFLCASGNRTSIHAARLAAKAAGAAAYVLQGGLSAWARAGLPTEVRRRG
jgi:rhodanese-related sulfurtransferase